MEYFYPRPPRGGRPKLQDAYDETGKFLSTPSARRATWKRSARVPSTTDFYPRPPRGGRRWKRGNVCRRGNFYPRPPRGGRPVSGGSGDGMSEFLSTPSARRATDGKERFRGILIFLSTPSARRATLRNRQSRKPITNFYPRPPRGGRQQKQRQNLYFQTNYTTFCTNLEEP